MRIDGGWMGGLGFPPPLLIQAYVVSDVTINSFILKFFEDYRKNKKAIKKDELFFSTHMYSTFLNTCI